MNSVTSFMEQGARDIAVSPSGAAVAVWYRRTGTNKYHIYSAKLPAGSSTWSTEIKVTTDQAAPKKLASVAVGSDGKAYAVWNQPYFGDADIWFATLPSGGSTWSTNAEASDDPGTFYQGYPDIGVDSQGNTLVSWSDWRTNPFQVRVRQRSSTGTWSPSVVVAADGANSPSLGVAPDGRAILTWYDGLNSQTPKSWVSIRDASSGEWGTLEQVSDTDSDNTAPSVAAITDGQAVVVWNDGGGSTTDIYARMAD